jgi:hypothetical protein
MLLWPRWITSDSYKVRMNTITVCTDFNYRFLTMPNHSVVIWIILPYENRPHFPHIQKLKTVMEFSECVLASHSFMRLNYFLITAFHDFGTLIGTGKFQNLNSWEYSLHLSTQENITSQQKVKNWGLGCHSYCNSNSSSLDTTIIRPWPPPSKSFPIHDHSYIILPSCAL